MWNESNEIFLRVKVDETGVLQQIAKIKSMTETLNREAANLTAMVSVESKEAEREGDRETEKEEIRGLKGSPGDPGPQGPRGIPEENDYLYTAINEMEMFARLVAELVRRGKMEATAETLNILNEKIGIIKVLIDDRKDVRQ